MGPNLVVHIYNGYRKTYKNIKSVYVIFVQDKNVCSLCTVWCTFLMFVIASSLKCVYDTLPNTRVEN